MMSKCAAAGGRPYWDWVNPGYSNPDIDLPYKHWAMFMPINARDPATSPTGLRECAVANASQTYQGAWGWTNEGCGLRLPYVCMTGELGRRSADSAQEPGPATAHLTHPGTRNASPCPPSAPAVSKQVKMAVPRFVAPATNATFVFNSSQMDYYSAADWCASQGGYPAAFSSLLEQYQAEQFFESEVGLALCPSAPSRAPAPNSCLCSITRHIADCTLPWTAGLFPAELPQGLLARPERGRAQGQLQLGRPFGHAAAVAATQLLPLGRLPDAQRRWAVQLERSRLVAASQDAVPPRFAQTPASLLAGDFIKEPDGQPTVLALCAAANASEAWGAPAAYGWSDEPCDGMELPVMCRLQGERHGLCLLPRSALWRRHGRSSSRPSARAQCLARSAACSCRRGTVAAATCWTQGA